VNAKFAHARFAVAQFSAIPSIAGGLMATKKPRLKPLSGPNLHQHSFLIWVSLRMALPQFLCVHRLGIKIAP
jgi:hypothetical protein